MSNPRCHFVDRADAGRQLATRLAAMALDRPVVYALPRGGVPVGVEIARALHAPLDLVLVRKIGAPGAPEVALGAVVEGEPAQIVINEDVRRSSGATDGFLENARQHELVELERRRARYLGDHPRVSPAGRTAIVVDDGLATGATAKAALIAIKRLGAARVILAVPVAPEETLAEFGASVDLVVCLHPARYFNGVGAFYEDFHQLSDDETIALLKQAWTAEGKADTASMLRAAVEPLPALDDPGFAAAFDRFGHARVVLLGEASHGTSEFYRARAAITRRLIEHHGFTIVAVEADWPDAAAIDRYVRHSPHQPQRSTPFTRFPTWMWRNKDVEGFTRFLRKHNGSRPMAERVGFYGLDLYNMTASIAAVLSYLDRVDPKAAAAARTRYACLQPWSREPAAYGRASLDEGYALCELPVTRILVDLLQKELQYTDKDGAHFLDAAQNARLVADAERYYRVMYHGSHESWNLRDQHMFDTLQHILAWAGPDKKAVVWAHNSHVGDARFTDMGTERGELNIGQLCRQEYGADAALIGFGTHTGTVAAASEWDAPMEVKTVRPSRSDSYEALFHQTGHARCLLDLRAGQHDALRAALAERRLERYIGVIYRPETERWSHYGAASLPDQYDAFAWFDETHAVVPLPTKMTAGEDETYPFGL
jgi:erythromycin esterase-like protein/predicted phosphoribosyltransferase